MARLIILARNSSVRQVNIASPITTIGRSGSNSVCIDSQRVSRHHAAIEWTGEHFLLTDMGSRNGTYVNNEKVRSHALVNGDAIVVGDCQLRFLLQPGLAAGRCASAHDPAGRTGGDRCAHGAQREPAPARAPRVRARTSGVLRCQRAALRRIAWAGMAVAWRRSAIRRATSCAANSSFLRSRASSAGSGLKLNE